MLDLICMSAIIFFLFFAMAFKIKRNNDLLDFESTNAMRGFWSIVVMLVHVPLLFQNKYQDIIGSFAYIGVTYFFMISGFGLQKSYMYHGDKALDKFWFKRLIKLFIPVGLIAIIRDVVILIFTKNYNFVDFIFINKWLLQLIVFYFFYWVIYKFLKLNNFFKVLIVSLIVCTYALIAYFFRFGWHSESFGFVYGLLLAYNYERIKNIFDKRIFLLLIISIFSSLLLGLLYIKFKNVYFIGGFLFKVLLGFAFVSLIVSINYLFKFNNAINQFLGRVSYETYLIHGTIFLLLTNICTIGDLSINSGVYILIAVIITLLMAFVVQILSDIIIKRIIKR